MTALQIERRLNDIENQINALLDQGVSEDDNRIINLRNEYNRIDNMEPSDSYKREWDNDKEDLIMF